MVRQTFTHDPVELHTENVLNSILKQCDDPANINLIAIKAFLLDEIRTILTTNPNTLHKFRKLLADRVLIEIAKLRSQEEQKNCLLQVRFWMEDEIILVHLRDPRHIEHLRQQLRERDPYYQLVNLQHHLTPRGGIIDLDIDFKSEYIRISNHYSETSPLPPDATISLVSQAIFLICSQDRILYALHDRSYAGAEDRLSKYALITGRLSALDIVAVPNGMSFQMLCKSTLIRELQELDELGLSPEVAQKYVHGNTVFPSGNSPRNRLTGVYEGKNGKVLSSLFTIFATVDEFNTELTKRGPYLVPVDETVFSYLRAFRLLNDILDYNSCSYCTIREHTTHTCHHASSPCIIRNVYEIVHSRIDLAEFKSVNALEEYNSNIGQYHISIDANSIIIAINISNYTLLQYTVVQEIRIYLQGFITRFLENVRSFAANFTYKWQATPQGYVVVFNGDTQSQKTLVAYFFAIYLTKELNTLRQTKLIATDVRLGLHTADLAQASDELFFVGNGINQSLDIADFAQNGQILCSLKYAVQLLMDIQRLDRELSLETIAFNNNRFHIQRENSKGGLWNRDEFSDLLKAIRLPPDTIYQLSHDPMIVSCFKEQGIPMHDFGFFVNATGVRQRIFNLGIFSETVNYGSEETPISQIPFIYRNSKTTKDEMTKLVESLAFAEQITMYGFSNIRMMKAMYKKLQEDSSYFRSLRELKIIFTNIEQYNDINEPKSSRLARADWIRGWLYAYKIADLLGDRVHTQVSINTTEYGFKTFKIIYDAKSEYHDHIRFTVPMPGNGFETSPLFIIYRGDPLYHQFLKICEKYIEEGISDNSNDISVYSYHPNSEGKALIDAAFETMEDINGVDRRMFMQIQKPNGGHPQRIHLGNDRDLLLAESDFDEACRLWKCLDYLEHDFRLETYFE